MIALTHTITWRLWPMSKRERNARTSIKLRSSWRHNIFFLLFCFWFGCVFTINDSLAWCYFIVWTCLHSDVSYIGRFSFEKMKIKINSKRRYKKLCCWNCHRSNVSCSWQSDLWTLTRYSFNWKRYDLAHIVEHMKSHNCITYHIPVHYSIILCQQTHMRAHVFVPYQSSPLHPNTI